MSEDNQKSTDCDCEQAKALWKQCPTQVKSSNGNVRKKAGNTGKRKRSMSRGRPKKCGTSKSRRNFKNRNTAKNKKRSLVRAGRPCMTNNPFLNFLRIFLKKNCGLRLQVAVKKCVEEWKIMCQDCKEKFIISARRVSRRKFREKNPNGPKC